MREHTGPGVVLREHTGVASSGQTDAASSEHIGSVLSKDTGVVFQEQEVLFSVNRQVFCEYTCVLPTVACRKQVAQPQQHDCGTNWWRWV